MPAVHDRGGWPNADPIDRTEHNWADWELKTHGLLMALRQVDIIVTDEMRRGIESLSLAQYEATSYYEKWSASAELLLIEKNVLTKDEIDTKVAEMDSRREPHHA